MEISKITNPSVQYCATISDANGNGIVDDNELDIFNEMQRTYKKEKRSANIDSNNTKNVTVTSVYIEECGKVSIAKSGAITSEKIQIGGCAFSLQEVASAKKEKDRYTIVLKNGVTVEYDKQKQDSSEINSCDHCSRTYFKGFSSGDGIKITGSAKNDEFYIIGDDSNQLLFSSIDGGDGKDTVHLRNTRGIAINGGKAPIKGEAIEYIDSENFSVQSSTEKIEDINEKKFLEAKESLKKLRKDLKRQHMSPERDYRLQNHIENHIENKILEQREYIDTFPNRGCKNYEIKNK